MQQCAGIRYSLFPDPAGIYGNPDVKSGRYPVEVIRRLQALGFRILLDDFGSGYSSLTMLNHLSIDVLKLDKTLIQDSDSRPNTRKILRSLIRLAQELGIEVVAEGVETKEQFAFLAQAGCDYIQGYYYARPEPAAEYVKLLKKR